MDSAKRVLVIGAGIAGTSLAYWLTRFGHSVVLIDRAESVQAEGHFMTLKGVAVELLGEMGVLDALRGHEWPSNEWDWCTHRGRHLRRVRKAAIGTTLGGFVSVRRVHLHQVLLDALPASVRVQTATEVTSLHQHQDGVQVQFGRRGRAPNNVADDTRFDAVVGADGVRSTLRAQYFSDLKVQRLNGHYVVFVANCRHDLGACTRTIWGPGRSVSLIPLSESQLGFMIYQDDDHPTPPVARDALTWRSYLAPLYADYPDSVRNGIAALQAEDEVFADEILMVPARELVTGRVALVGDAGYAPTFFSGMGAAAALLGSYTMAKQLSKTDDVGAALAAYQSIMVPLALGYQRSAYGGPQRTMARGARRVLLNVMTAAIPERLGAVLSRRQYQADVTLRELG